MSEHSFSEKRKNLKSLSTRIVTLKYFYGLGLTLNPKPYSDLEMVLCTLQSDLDIVLYTLYSDFNIVLSTLYIVLNTLYADSYIVLYTLYSDFDIVLYTLYSDFDTLLYTLYSDFYIVQGPVHLRNMLQFFCFF
jgi:hypothetical protein